ncbi:MAG: response regulator [Rickettsiales bacterium]|nr:response regulator [Rickettsiales bacterium]
MKPLSSQGAAKRSRFKNIKVLVTDYDKHIRNLVKGVLEDFGFQQIHMATNGKEAVEIIQNEAIDLLITEWPMTLVDGKELVNFIRVSGRAPRQDLPIIMLTGKAEKEDVLEARDFGVTEFVVKPFTAKTLSHRIIQVVDNPRPFIITEEFVGPERRRHAEGAEGEDNRTPIELMRKHGRPVGDKMVYEVNGKRVIVAKPNTTLKEYVGRDVSAEFILDDDVIAAAQESILEKADEYKGWILEDLKIMEQAYDRLEANADDTEAMELLTKTSLTIKSRAGTFSYDLATAVAKLLYNYLATSPALNKLTFTVIRKHIDTLYVIFHQSITGNDNKVGTEVVDGLGILIEKISQIQQAG